MLCSCVVSCIHNNDVRHHFCIGAASYEWTCSSWQTPGGCRVKEKGGVRKLRSSRLGRQYSRMSLFHEEENDAGHVRAPSSSSLAAASSVNT
uniref:Uncharacterized protein n=1 Tax=Tanacetum cinerariifolium TaxID=118510 RepID=A0A699RNQ2_TANCI|nr:hypothetical protein [Tanacetum cinerariifolium]